MCTFSQLSTYLQVPSLPSQPIFEINPVQPENFRSYLNFRFYVFFPVICISSSSIVTVTTHFNPTGKTSSTEKTGCSWTRGVNGNSSKGMSVTTTSFCDCNAILFKKTKLLSNKKNQWQHQIDCYYVFCIDFINIFLIFHF